jgi:hypothetical protein
MDTQLGARHRRRTPTIHRGRTQRTISAGSFDEIQQVAGRDVCNAGQNLVGSHGGRRDAGVDGSLNSGFSLLERNRFAVGKTAISLVSPRPQQLAPSGRARLLLEPRRSAVLISGLTTHGGGLGPFLAV